MGFPWSSVRRAFWTPEDRQGIALLALIQGAMFALLGATAIFCALTSPPKGLGPTVSVMALGFALSFGGGKVCAWGYRTVSVQSLNAYALIGVVLATVSGAVGWYERFPLRESVAISGAFLGFSIVLFLIGRIKAEGADA